MLYKTYLPPLAKSAPQKSLPEQNWYAGPLPPSRYDPRPTSRRNKLLPVIDKKGIASIVPWYTGRPTNLYNGAIGISGTAAKN